MIRQIKVVYLADLYGIMAPEPAGLFYAILPQFFPIKMPALIDDLDNPAPLSYLMFGGQNLPIIEEA